jgi:hypothetical protein
MSNIILPKITPVTTSGWSWISQGNAVSYSTIGGVILVKSSDGGIGTNRFYVRDVPTAPYTATFRFKLLSVTGATGGNWILFGGVLYNTVSSKYITIIFKREADALFSDSQMRLKIGTDANYEAYCNGTAGYIPTSAFSPVTHYFQIQDDSTNRYIRTSLDGINWYTSVTHANNTYITPNKIGWMLQAYNRDIILQLEGYTLT